MQLRFASFAVINLRWDLHPQECARAGRTRKRLLEAGVDGEEIRLLCRHLANLKNRYSAQRLAAYSAQLRLELGP